MNDAADTAPTDPQATSGTAPGTPVGAGPLPVPDGGRDTATGVGTGPGRSSSRVGPGRLLEAVTLAAALAAVATVGTVARGDLSGEDAAALSSPTYTCPGPTLTTTATGTDRSGSGSWAVSRVSPAALHTDTAPARTADPGTDALARALRAQGRGRFSDVYGAVVLDRTRGRVALCVTDLERGRALALAARAADPRLDLARVDLFSCRFTEREGRAALSALRGVHRPALGFPVYAAGFSADASGLQVLTTASGAASGPFLAGLVDAAGGMPVYLVARP